MEEQPDSDAQPVEIEEQPQEEQPQEELEPIRDVETFWTRLDDVLQHLESQPQPGTKPVRSFIYQPELLSINSQDDIGTETENSANPFFFNTFTIRLVKPCVNVKGLQLLRCSFPTPVTNIPNEECTFWYYRFIKWITGTAYSINTLVIDPTDGNFYLPNKSIGSSSVHPGADPTNWTSIGQVASNSASSGVITSIAPTLTLPISGFLSNGNTVSAYVGYVNPTTLGWSIGQQIKISGADTVGFNGVFLIYGFNYDSVSHLYLITMQNTTTGGTSTATMNADITYTGGTTGLYVGMQVTVSGATTSAYNGSWTIKNVTDTSFTVTGAVSGASSKATWSAASVTQPYLYMIRLQPSWVPPELVGTQYAYNRTFTDYADLVLELNKACANDPLVEAPATSYDGGTYKYLKNDIIFSYNQTYNKIVFTGQNVNSYYLPASYSDNNIFDLGSAANDLNEQTTGIVPPTFTGSPDYSLGGVAGNGQPYKNYRTLNLRLGWTWNGNLGSIPDYKNQIRPVPLYYYNYMGTGVGVPCQTINTPSNIAPSYACLVNTGSVRIYLDSVGGSSQDSEGNGGVLATVPLNTQNNGVGFFDRVFSHKLTKIPSQLQELRFTLKDEQGNPFLLPNSAVVNLEIGVEY